LCIGGESYGNMTETAALENALEFDSFASKDEGLSDAWKDRAAKELNEDPDKLESELRDLWEFLDSNKKLFENLPRDEKFLQKFIRAKSHDMEKVKEMLTRYCIARTKFKENYRSSLPSASVNTFSYQIQTVLLHRDKQARRVFLFRVGNWDPSIVSKEELFSANYLCLELMAREPKTQISGISALVDMEGLSWSHWMQMSMDYIQSMVGMVQNSFPIRFKEIHIINESPIFQVAYALVKPFLTEKMQQRLMFHGSSKESLEKIIPARILPQEMGGEAGQFSNQELLTELLGMEEFFIQMQNIEYEGCNQ